MYQPHLLILAAHVLLRAVILPTIGVPEVITARFPTMTACKLIGAEVIAAAPDDDVNWSCTARYAA